jgi:tetratricopeptide (TPR) repeat protein
MGKKPGLPTALVVLFVALSMALFSAAGVTAQEQAARESSSTGAAEAATATAVRAIIRVERPMVHPDTAASRRTIEDALLQAARHTRRVSPELRVEVPWYSDGSGGAAGGAAPTAPETYTLTINAVGDGGSSDGSSNIMLILTGRSGTAAGRQASGIPLTGRWDGDLYRDISRQMIYLRAEARGFEQSNPEGAPRFVDELYLSELAGSTITTEGANLYPYTVATTGDGDVVVGAVTVALRLGPDFRIRDIPGQFLLDEGNYSSAMTVAVTPAGTVVTRPSMGRDLFLYPPGQAEPARLRNPLSGQGGLSALSDGSVVVVDATSRRAVRLEGRSVTPLNIHRQEYSYIPAVAAGPEGTIWAYDTIQRTIFIYSPGGELLDAVLPMMPVEDAAATRAMAVGDTGDFLLLTMNGLRRFDRSGRMVWSADSIVTPHDPAGAGAAVPLGGMMSVAWHEPSGSIYLADYTGQRVIRLVEGGADVDPFTAEILELNDRLSGRQTGDGAGGSASGGGRSGAGGSGAPDDGWITPTNRAALLTRKADLYLERGALEMAQAQWQNVLDEDPWSTVAMDRIDEIEVELLMRRVVELDRRVRTLLLDFGRETARRDYERTIRLYERILNLDPQRQPARRAKGELEGLFEGTPVPSGPEFPLEVVRLTVPPLFPVLLPQYRGGGAGVLQLRNPAPYEVVIVSATLDLPGFTDGPTEVEIPPSLGPGATARVDLPLLLNRTVLTLQEDLPARAAVEIIYRPAGGSNGGGMPGSAGAPGGADSQASAGGSGNGGGAGGRAGGGAPEHEHDGDTGSARPAAASPAGSSTGPTWTATASTTTTVHRRSALVWDDSAKLAGFITPNEDIVAGFALRVLASLGADESPVSEVSPRLVRAARLADAVGTYGIQYIEDPQSPFSRVHGGDSYPVDTVRFPRLTLYYRSGDCDDTSALLASMYEAAGLETAIVTTPGHVLIAFNTGEPRENRWFFDTSGTTVLERNGTLWIPVETTVLERGFSVAWQEGSHLVRKHLPAGEVEFIPVASARERYAALPLPEPSFTITEPAPRAIAAAVSASTRQIGNILYNAGLAGLEQELAERSGGRRVPVLNRIGILHGRSGYHEEGEAVFREILHLRDDYLPAYINLAHIALSRNRPDEALTILTRAEEIRPGNGIVLELLVRTHLEAGRNDDAGRALTELREVAPERATLLAGIMSSQDGRAARAGDLAAALPPAAWDAGSVE